MSKLGEYLKAYLKDMSIEVLEYMGKTDWYLYYNEDNYKDFRLDVEGLNEYDVQPVYYYMCRDKSGKIIYIGHTGANFNSEWKIRIYKTEIVELTRPPSTYKKGMYIQNKNSISPMKNGHEITTNCWNTLKTIYFDTR